jgi:hypothetical protein
MTATSADDTPGTDPGLSPGVEEPASSWREVAALVLLPFGGVIVPVAGWFVGVFFLWASGAWTRSEKLLGTLIVPGGLLLPLLLLTLGLSGSGGSNVPVIVLCSAFLAAPLAAILFLGLRLRGR